MNEMNKSLVCIDASLMLKLVLPEEHSEQASRLWKDWLMSDTRPVAPLLLRYEVTSALRKNVYRGLIAQNSADKAFAGINQVMASQVRIMDPDDLHEKPWELARRFNRPTAYDCHYLALAKSVNCPFGTADERLFNVVRNELEWVYWLGNYSC